MVARDDVTGAGDAALVVAIGRWREEALAEAYRRHGGAVFGLARRVTSSEALAEEVVQEVFVRLWRHPERFDPDRGSLRAFLLADGHGRAVDLLRSETSRHRREQADAVRTATGGYDLEHEVWDLTLADGVRRALGSLSPDERQAIELAYFGGQSYRQVAVALELPEGTVKSRIRSGLQRLRAALVEAGVELG